MQYKTILFPMLEEMGLENVKEKLKLGSFKHEKLEFVKEWIDIKSINLPSSNVKCINTVKKASPKKGFNPK
jgi:hypothetical protein